MHKLSKNQDLKKIFYQINNCHTLILQTVTISYKRMINNNNHLNNIKLNWKKEGIIK